MELIIIGLLVMLVIALIIGLIDINTKLKNSEVKNTQNESKINELYDEKYSLQMKNDNLREDLFKLSEARNLLELEANLVATEKNKLQSELEYLRPEYFKLKESISVSAVKNDSAEDLDDELMQLRGLIEAKNEELVKLTESSNFTTAAINEKLGRLEELDASIRALEGRILSDEKRVEEIKGLLEILNHDLDDLTNLKASVLAVEEGVGSV